MKVRGWLLEVGIREDRALLWIKEEGGGTMRLADRYLPELYVEPKGEQEGCELLRRLGEEGLEAGWEERRVSLSEARPRKLLRVRFPSSSQLDRAKAALGASPLVRELYNADLLHVQRYLFTRLRIEPTSYLEAEERGGLLMGVERIGDEEGIEPPPFSCLYFNPLPGHEVGPRPEEAPLRGFELSFEGEGWRLEGSEEELLRDFMALIRRLDPDLLFAPEPWSFSLPYLLRRAEARGLRLELGREAGSLCAGRALLSYESYGQAFDEAGWGLAGLVERCRFACLPPSIAGRWTANRINDSRICFELIGRGYVIPPNRGAFEFSRPLGHLYARDRGGLLIAPKPGEVLYNVAELDFSSLYPSLIVKRGISFESVGPEGLLQLEDAILPSVVKAALERRLRLKGLRGLLQRGSREWLWCEQRQLALKLILCCCYGTSGCCWNRFGNVLAFEEINKASREVMAKAKDLALAEGFEVVYGDTDSLFVKGEGATREGYERLAQEISERLGLPMGLDHHFKFLVFLPLKGERGWRRGALKRYYGLLWDGGVVARGIELRRRDAPKLVKELQLGMIRALLDCESAGEVREVGLRRCLELVREARRRLLAGGPGLRELLMARALRREPEDYSVMAPHVAAALQLKLRGLRVRKGELVGFAFANARHRVRLLRVAPYELMEGRAYDRERYGELLLSAAHTVLSPFMGREQLERLLR